jgi:uncharacterized protein (DUF849 family)
LAWLGFYGDAQGRSRQPGFALLRSRLGQPSQLYPATKRIRNEAAVYRVPFEAARRQLEKIQQLGMRATVQMFDPSYARATLLFLEQGLLTEPLMINFISAARNCRSDCR